MKELRQKVEAIFEQMYIDEELRLLIAMEWACIVMALIAATMFVINSVIGVRSLALVSGCFFLISLFSAMLVYKRAHIPIAVALMAGSVISMLIYFLISGGTQGYSAIWIFLLPSGGMFFFGIRRGTVISLITLGIVLAILWTPLYARFSYEYSSAFQLRFPIVYISSFIMAFSLEYLRYNTHKRLVESRNEIEKLSQVDDLTQIFNRRYFYMVLGNMWEIAIRTGQKLSLLIIDVDVFKLYNDKHGHLAGDHVLKQVAAAMKSCAGRTNDIVARIGGDEFAVLLPFTDGDGARRIAEEIRQAVLSLGIPHDREKKQGRLISVSIGAATIYPISFNKPDDLFEAADRDLYQEKKRTSEQ